VLYVRRVDSIMHSVERACQLTSLVHRHYGDCSK